MKKFLFMLAAATLTLASCNNEEPVALNEGHEIQFNPAMATRGMMIDNNSLGSIKVYAFKVDPKNGSLKDSYFTNLTFTAMAESGTYTSSPRTALAW